MHYLLQWHLVHYTCSRCTLHSLGTLKPAACCHTASYLVPGSAIACKGYPRPDFHLQPRNPLIAVMDKTACAMLMLFLPISTAFIPIDDTQYTSISTMSPTNLDGAPPGFLLWFIQILYNTNLQYNTASCSIK